MNTAPDTVRSRSVLLAIGITVAASALVVALAALIQFEGPPKSEDQEAPVAPALAGPSEALLERARANEALERWEWVDRERGVVAMPIDEAMAIVASSPGQAP